MKIDSGWTDPQKKAMLAFAKKWAEDEAQEVKKELAMKTKKSNKAVPVNELYAAIKNGMSYEEAAEHALASIKDELDILKEDRELGGEGEGPDMEGIIALLVEKNDHSIRFDAEEDRDGGLINWWVNCVPYYQEVDSIPYFATERTWGEDEANNDAYTLSQFVLDFYGIKKHTVRKLTKKEAKDQIKEIKREIKSKTKEIKDLTSKMNRLSKIV